MKEIKQLFIKLGIWAIAETSKQRTFNKFWLWKQMYQDL